MDKISVIVPVYNVEKYLKRCVESIIAQTYRNIEIILVNDGSTDNSPKICDEFALMDSRIKVIHKKNEGVSAARNTGIVISTGQFIAFCDSDDWLDVDMLSYLYQLMKKTSCEIASCPVWYDYDDKKRNSSELLNKEKIYNAKEAIIELHKGRYLHHWVWNNLFKRELIEKQRFSCKLSLGEDYVFMCKALDKCNGIIVGSKPKYHYFQRQSSVCNAGYTYKNYQSLLMYNQYRKYFIEKYPEYVNIFDAHFILEEMAVITAMIKNDKFNRSIIKQIQSHIKRHLREYFSENSVSFYYKVSAFLIVYSLNSFKVIYKLIKK